MDNLPNCQCDQNKWVSLMDGISHQPFRCHCCHRHAVLLNYFVGRVFIIHPEYCLTTNGCAKYQQPIIAHLVERQALFQKIETTTTDFLTYASLSSHDPRQGPDEEQPLKPYREMEELPGRCVIESSRLHPPHRAMLGVRRDITIYWWLQYAWVELK